MPHPQSFRLVVISPEDEHPDELALLPRLFASGLTRYHLRKPAWTRARLTAHLDAIAAEYHPRILLHSHHDLAAHYDLGGLHAGGTPANEECGMQDAPSPFSISARGRVISRPLHTLAELRAALATYPPTHDTLLVSPLFPSISKPGYAPSPGALPLPPLAFLLHSRPFRTPQVLALGGITPARLAAVAALGFDGAALLGALWQSPAPLAAWHSSLSEISNLKSQIPFPLIAITHDNHPLGDHPAQARALCAAGAKHIQLRTKNSPPDRWLALAREVTAICREHGALCIINDNPEIARDAGAGGVHLGTQDAPWSAARRLLGPDAIIGGTVNNARHARAAAAARAAGDLDYIGIGPFRHTTTKQNLAGILGPSGIHEILTTLPPALPAFVIGGVLPADLPVIRSLGAAGVAVSGALLNAPDLPARHREFLASWQSPGDSNSKP